MMPLSVISAVMSFAFVLLVAMISDIVLRGR